MTDRSAAHQTVMPVARRLRLVAPGLALALLVPGAALASNHEVSVTSNPAVVFVLIVLLAGSVTAGIFFASPWRRRLGASVTVPSRTTMTHTARRSGGLPPMPGGDIFGAEAEPAAPAPARPSPPAPANSPSRPAAPRALAPWSTGRARGDSPRVEPDR